MDAPNWNEILADATRKVPARIPVVPEQQVVLALHAPPWSVLPNWFFMTMDVR
jgi:hypothetical protein